MTIARLRHKVSLDEPSRLEDLLTSDVLGALRYLPVADGIGPVLDLGVDEHARPFRSVRTALALDWHDASARLKFWPPLDGGEPDVLARVWSGTSTEPSLAALIEVKLDSPQHEIDDDGRRLSQLGWYVTRHLRWNWQMPATERRRCVAFFLTAHRAIPVAELVRARREAALATGVPPDEIGLFWIGWRAVAELSRNTWLRAQADCHERPWMRAHRDIVEHLDDRGLVGTEPFEAIGPPPPLAAGIGRAISVVPPSLPSDLRQQYVLEPPPTPPPIGAVDAVNR